MNETNKSTVIKVDKCNPNFLHIQDLNERVAAQIQKGQFFKKSDQSIVEILNVKDDMVSFKFINGKEVGKRIFKTIIFAQLFNNKYYMQINDPNQKIEWELNKNFELERFLR